jgi:hypothetical protein
MNRQCNTDFQGALMDYFDWIWQWSHQKSLWVPACFLWQIEISSSQRGGHPYDPPDFTCW